MLGAWTGGTCGRWGHRRGMTVRRLALIGGLVLGWSASALLPAGALTCARFPENTPESLVGNRLTLTDPDTRNYDMAVVGTVRRITTDESEDSATYGRTLVEVELDGLFYDGVFGATPTDVWLVTSPDPGWLHGYGFVEGRSYFIPLLLTGPLGEPNYSFVCDPITEVADPASTAAELARIAIEIDLGYHLGPVGGETSSGAGTTIAIALFAGLIAWTLLRNRKHRQPPPGRDPRELPPNLG